MSKVKFTHASGNSMSIAAPASNPASNLELTLPTTIGSADQYMKVDGSGNLGWVTPPSAGKIIAVSSYTKTNTASTNVAQGAYSEAFISLSYAAASSSNKLLIIANFSISVDSAATVYATLHIGGSASGYRGDGAGSRNRTSTAARTGNSGGLDTMSIVYLHSSPSTSSTAYDVRGSHANDATQNMYINRMQTNGKIQKL